MEWSLLLRLAKPLRDHLLVVTILNGLLKALDVSYLICQVSKFCLENLLMENNFIESYLYSIMKIWLMYFMLKHCVIR